jgi:hypothetical protein
MRTIVGVGAKGTTAETGPADDIGSAEGCGLAGEIGSAEGGPAEEIGSAEEGSAEEIGSAEEGGVTGGSAETGAATGAAEERFSGIIIGAGGGVNTRAAGGDAIEAESAMDLLRNCSGVLRNLRWVNKKALPLASIAMEDSFLLRRPEENCIVNV